MALAAADTGVLVQDVVYAGLDALRAVVPLELCGYVHTTDAAGPQLYLRAPELAALEATAAFDLFTSMHTLLDAGDPRDRDVEVGGFLAVAVPTAGTASRGLFVVGRPQVPLDLVERASAVQLSRAVGAACHAMEASARPTPERAPLRVLVETGEITARAEVVVPRGDGLRKGTAEASSPVEAVALATLDAVAPDLKLGAAADDEVGGERTMLTLVRGDHGQSAVGAALCGADPLRATAMATLDAAARLRRHSAISRLERA